MNREEAEKKVRENKCEYPNCNKQAVDKFPQYLCEEHVELKIFIQRFIDIEMESHRDAYH